MITAAPSRYPHHGEQRITRRNHGGGHSYRIDGVKTPGVTTILGATMPKPALIEWAGKTTAGYAVDHWEELGAEPPSKRLDRLNHARFADRDTAANRGTELHRLYEQHMTGAEVEIPDELEGHFRAYEAFVADWDPQPVLVEAVVASRQIGYAGTVDMVADLANGRRLLLDYKTSRSGVYAETALQLCAYLHAEVYLDQDGAEQPMAELGIAGAAALHVTADGYRLLPVDVGPAVWKYFRHLAWLYRQADQLAEWIGTAVDAPACAR